MSRKTKVEFHLTTKEIQEKIANASKSWLVKRWMIIYTASVEPRLGTAIARQVGASSSTVSRTIRAYNKLGVSGIETEGRGGRRNAYLSIEDEKDLVESFKTKASSGHITTVHEINKEFERMVGHAVGKKTIYFLLHRNGWRKVMPRPYHPKSNQEVKETFKKKIHRNCPKNFEQKKF